MANLAQIQSIAQGQFFVKDSLGNLTELKVGDTVSLNDTIVAASSNTDLSKIEILFDTNELITLSQGEQLLDATLLASTFGNEELAFDKQEVDETLNAWNNTEAGDATDMETAAGDVTEQATNAGDERAADGGALRSKFNSRTGDSTDVRSDLRDTSFGGGNPENPQEQIPTELLNPVDTRVPASVITLSDPIVKEGNQITITATVTNPPQTDLIITLNNGQTITIPAGQTAGSVTFDNPNSEDVYIDNSTETYTITGTTGGNYVSLDTSDSSVVTIEDTPDTTTVKISGTDTTEGGKATFELELSNKPQTGTTATGKVEVDGKSYDVTFDADGKATLTVDVKANDVYNGEPTLTAKVTEISGGNFEKVNPNAQKTITVKDTPDTTTVKISGTDTTEGGKATFELELSNKPQTGTTATGKVEVDGKSYDVTFDADGKATLTVDVKANDVYNGEPTLTAKVTEISGGNFEKVNPNAQKTITVKDTPDTTTVKISGTDTTEGGKATFELELSNKPQTGTTATGKVEVDGKSYDVTFDADGKATLTVDVKANDVYNGEPTLTAKVTEISGGNFEKVNPNAQKTITVKDTPDTTTVKISGTDTTEGGKATFELELSNKPQTGTTATGKVEVDGKSYDVTFDADGKATLTVDVKANDVYNGEPTLTAKVTEISGGNFEKVNPNAQKTITVKDTPDTTTVKISGTDTTEGGKATFELELSNKPQTGTTATGKVEVDGKSYDVTFDADGKATLTVDVKANDVYNGEPTLTAKVTEISGGNFEKVNPNAQKTITVKDTPDTTTVKISGTDTTEGGKATFELELSNKPQTGTTATGKVEVDGKSYDVTFDADGKATLTVDVKANDVYNGEPTLTAKVTEISGGNFEKVNPNAQKTITVKDTPDTTTVKISGTDTTEGGKATFELELSNKPQTGTTATGKVEVDGKSYDVTFDADGKATLTVDVKANDVYNGEPTLTAKVTEISGGNFEKVNPNAQKTITVKDTPDTTTVKITANPVQEGQDIVFTATVDADKTPKTDLVISVKDSNGNEVTTITILKGQTTGSSNPVTNPNTDDVYKDGETLNYTTEVKSGGTEYEKLNTTPVSVVVTDTITPIDVTITATVTTPKIIDVNTKTDGTTGVKVTGYNSDGKETNLSIIKGTNHDGFGVDGKNLSNGDTKELGKGEKIVVEFTNGKDVNSLDVSFAWRNNHETAKLTFVKDGQIVGYATVDGDGKSTTKAIVKYYDENNTLIKEVNAKGSSDKVDEAFTFELPDSNGEIVSFDKVEFSAPKNKDDYLINKIVYKEVLDPTVTDIVTNGGNVTFNIQVDENYPPQVKATAVVEINNIKYDVVLNATGRGTLTLDSSKLGTDLSNVKVKVLEVKGGNYEKVNSVKADFDFTPTVNTPTSTDDTISTDEDVSYTLKVTDFGEVSSNTKEFKITELPTPEIGKLFLNITKGETIFNPDGTEAVATQDSRVEITKGQIVTLGQVGAGKVEFVPNHNSDVDGSFKFIVGDGNGNFSEEYTTTIDVKAVADAPTVSINVTKIGATTNPSIEPTQKIGTTDSIKNIGTNGDDIIEVNKELVMNDNINLGNGKDTLILNKNINQVTIDLGNGNDKVVINGQVNGTNNIHLGNGDDVIVINNIVTNNTHINGGNGKDTLFLSGNKSDYNFNWQTNNNGMIEGSITDKKGGGTIQYNQMETIVFGDGSYIGQKPQEEAPQTIFKVDISAALTDTDGSEKLSDVTLKNIPEGSKLFGADKQEILANSDGSYTVKVDETGKAKLTLESQDKLSEDELNSIKASATSTENSNDDSATTTVSQNLGKDIDLSGLTSILEEQKTGDIDLSKNGSQDKLTLTLDDVLKLSGDDGKIKITGDQFDSVAFKNTTGENGQEQTWSKTAGEGEDAGFDIYVNSGDSTVQVKVEQPISDGITN